MRGVAAADRGAFEVLMARHLPRVVRLAGRILWDKEDAHDLAQEIFLKLWDRAGSFDAGRALFKTWLYRLVVNAALDRQRRFRSFLSLEAAGEVPDGAPSADDVIEDGQQGILLRAAIAALPDRQRIALALYYFEDCSGEEAAEALRMSRGAFDVLLHRARKALRSELEKGGGQ